VSGGVTDPAEARFLGGPAGAVEIRNEVRVHLWYADHFGTPAPPFRKCAEAIDSFAPVCCCYGLTVDPDGRPCVYAPHGYADLFDLVVRPAHRPAVDRRGAAYSRRGMRISVPSGR
jgi:hypothetical protein